MSELISVRRLVVMLTNVFGVAAANKFNLILLLQGTQTDRWKETLLETAE